MPFEVGDIVKGTVSGIAKFGAFVDLGDGKSGLIHISEIAEEFVEKVEDYVKRGDEVRVKVLNIEKDGKIALSLSKAQPKKENRKTQSEPVEWTNKTESTDASFEDKLDRFLKESGEKYDQLRFRQGKKTGQRY